MYYDKDIYTEKDLDEAIKFIICARVQVKQLRIICISTKMDGDFMEVDFEHAPYRPDFTGQGGNTHIEGSLIRYVLDMQYSSEEEQERLWERFNECFQKMRKM